MPELWTAAQLAEFLQTSTQELSQMRCDGTGPKFIKFRRQIRYVPRDVSTWLETISRTSTKETADAKP